MTNVYEALQRARKERDDAERFSFASAEGRAIRRVPLATPEVPIEPQDSLQDINGIIQPSEFSQRGDRPGPDELGPIDADPRLKYHFTEMVSLLNAIRPLLEPGGTIVHLVSATMSEGASSIARDLAYTAATEGNQHTLLIDANVDEPNSADFFQCPRRWGLLDCLDEQVNDRLVLRTVAGSKLSVGRLVGEAGSHPIDADRVGALYELVRGRYDMTVMDCPPITGNRYGGLLPQIANGIVLVIEAEKLRPAVVVHAKELLQQAGGKILGAVLNRRKNYIPEFVYKRL